MRNLWKIIIIAVITSFITCYVMDKCIKKKALNNSLNEELVENLIVGSYIELPDNTYIVCTEENIKNITINDKYVYTGLFGTSANVEFTIEASTYRFDISTEGRIKLNYSSHARCKWVVDRWWLSDDIDIENTY